MRAERRERFRGAFVGLAAGDAVGTAVEFMPRGSFEPIDDMIGGGPFGLSRGEWTDDTSMALCLAASLIRCRGFDARDQMDRYVKWWREGYMSCTGHCFDIGNTVRAALGRFRETGDPYAGSPDPMSAGNGSLMRLAPVVMFYHPDREAAVHYAGESSRTTHGAQEAIDACKMFAQVLDSALAGLPKPAVLSIEAPAGSSPRLTEIANRAYRDKPESEIRGTGYVVDCLEAALWCFERTETFRDAVLAAANLGDDADTTAAVVGQVAGAYYGMTKIPPHWVEQLALREKIIELADALHQAAG